MFSEARIENNYKRSLFNKYDLNNYIICKKIYQR